MYKKIKTDIVLDHPRITVLQDTIVLPNGEETDYIRLDENRHGVSIVAKNQEGKFLLEKDYSYIPNKKIFTFPAGEFEKGEKPEEAANRELMEETGFYSNKLTYLGKRNPWHRRVDNNVYLFYAEELVEKTLSMDKEEEGIEVHWFAEEDIDKMIRDEIIKDQNTMTSWCMYKLKKEELS